MRHNTLWLLIFVMLVTMTFAVSAQDELPAESPQDNACYTGGSLEGKCDWPTDGEDEWAWNCGWYIARYDTGAFTVGQIPVWCNFFADPVDDGTSPTLTCYYSGLSVLPDFTLTGALNTLDNATFHFIDDAHTCSVPSGDFGTVVQAETEGEALTICGGLYSPLLTDVAHLSTEFGYVNTPDDWYAYDILAA